MGEQILVGGLDAEESHDLADFPVLEQGRIARGYAGCFDVTPDWHPDMMAALFTDGPGGHPDLATFRLSRFAEGKPIRGTYGDWLMC